MKRLTQKPPLFDSLTYVRTPTRFSMTVKIYYERSRCTSAVNSVCGMSTKNSELFSLCESVHLFSFDLNFIVNNLNDHRNKRTCKCGAGQEENVGKCDTPGFPLSTEPCIIRDHRRAKKLHLPRNNRRVNQCSLNVLQSWRGNCDIQILIYDCNPKKPNMSELAVVTDYIVSYSCKGNNTLKEERDQSRAMILG